MAARYPQTILVGCEIPWDERVALLEDSFRREIRALRGHGFNHLYVFGTAGEGYAVTDKQYRQIAEVFWEETRKEGVFPMVGVIAMSTPKVLERMRFAFELGVRAFQISLPPWGALNDGEYLAFFSQVCGAFPEAHFMHYNLPRARRVLLGPEYRRLVAEVPNLAGTKNYGTDLTHILSIATGAPELQHFYGEHGFPHGCLFGECSLLSSFGALFPKKTWEFFQYGVDKQWDKLFPMQAEYLKVMEDFLAPTQGRQAIDGAYDKMIVRASGLDMPLRLLPPFKGFAEQTFKKCQRQLRPHAAWRG